MTSELWTAAVAAPALRPYQVEADAQVKAAWAAGHRAPLLCLPTGAGKTVNIAALAAWEIAERGATPGAVVIAVPRRELVGQTVAKLRAEGLTPGVVCASMDAEAGRDAAVQVCSVDTLHSRVQRGGALRMPPPRVLVLDEAHLTITARKVALVEALRPARILGCTATPVRKDGRALGLLFDVLLEPATVASLTAEQWLVPVRAWSWPPPDLSGVRIDTTTKDYRLDELAAVVNRPKLLGDIVEHWCRLGSERQTVAFTVDIKHAIALAEEFRRVGVAAESLSAETPLAERQAILARFRTGAVRVVCNCFVLAYGFDLPEIACVILARPTQSVMLYMQMTGRALRPAPGKTDCLVLDHAGTVHRHGFITDARVWTLEGRTGLVENATHTREPKGATVCPNCAAIFTASPTCPECGHQLRPTGRLVPTREGSLVELGAGATPEAIDRRAFYAELRGLTAQRGYKPGFAKAKFRERFNAWPPWSWDTDPPVPPSLTTEHWVLARQIAWRKAGR